MDDTLAKHDWSLIQAFIAVAEAGSLSGASRRISRSQPTLGRQIQSLEMALGVSLFDRHARGLKLSDTGTSILPAALRMRDAMNAISLTAAGQIQSLKGTVRITASDFASHHILPRILAEIRKREPDIQLDLLPSNATENLLFREADIAVRMYRPTQLDIITRHVADIEMAAFAARSYLDRVGRPEEIHDILACDLVGFDRDDLIVRTMRAMGWHVSRGDFPVRCDNQVAYWELVRAGCGIGFTMAQVGRADPLVEELQIDVKIPHLPVWLTAHQAMQRTPRIRRVWDILAEGLQRPLS